VNRSTRAIIGTTLAALAVTALAACSGGSSGGSTTSAAPTSTESPIGGNVLPPVMVEPGQTEVTAKVGSTIVFKVDDPANSKIATDNPEVLEVTQGSDDGSAQFNPGAKALKAGKATVTVTSGAGVQTVAVTVTD